MARTTHATRPSALRIRPVNINRRNEPTANSKLRSALKSSHPLHNDRSDSVSSSKSVEWNLATVEGSLTSVEEDNHDGCAVTDMRFTSTSEDSSEEWQTVDITKAVETVRGSSSIESILTAEVFPSAIFSNARRCTSASEDTLESISGVGEEDPDMADNHMSEQDRIPEIQDLEPNAITGFSLHTKLAIQKHGEQASPSPEWDVPLNFNSEFTFEARCPLTSEQPKNIVFGSPFTSTKALFPWPAIIPSGPRLDELHSGSPIFGSLSYSTQEATYKSLAPSSLFPFQKAQWSPSMTTLGQNIQQVSMNNDIEESLPLVKSDMGQKILNPKAPTFRSLRGMQKPVTPRAKAPGIAVSRQENFAPGNPHTSNAKAGRPKQRVIVDDSDAPGREVKAFELWYGGLHMTEFVKKYPLTGTKGKLSRKSSKGPMNGIPPKASAIQEEIEKKLLLMKEKKAISRVLSGACIGREGWSYEE